jgi:formate dehydrogenase maturation protein FdhE
MLKFGSRSMSNNKGIDLVEGGDEAKEEHRQQCGVCASASNNSLMEKGGS